MNINTKCIKCVKKSVCMYADWFSKSKIEVANPNLSIDISCKEYLEESVGGKKK